MSDALGPFSEISKLPLRIFRTSSERAEVSSLRLSLVDSDPASHQALRNALRTQAQNWHLESYFDPKSAIQGIPVSRPRAVLVNVWESHNPEPRLIRQLRSLFHDLPVLVLTTRRTLGSIVLSLMAGATGFLIKPLSDEEVVNAVMQAALGATVLCKESQKVIASILRQIDAARALRHLTFREKETLISLMQGQCPKEIANDLGVATGTVRAHISNIYRKLEAHNSDEALRKLLEVNLTTQIPLDREGHKENEDR